MVLSESIKFKNTKKILSFFLLISCVLYIGFKVLNRIELTNNNPVGVLDSTNFTLKFKKIYELEYAVGDSVIDIKKNTPNQKTLKHNNKFEIYLNEKNKEINSIHFFSLSDNINEKDISNLKGIYNFTFSSLSTYFYDKTIETLKMMCSKDYVSTKSGSLSSDNYILSESIHIGKTSEIRITVNYKSDSSKNKAQSVDIAILKGNKW